MALRVPDAQTFMQTDDYTKELWYRFFTSIVNDLPQNGNVAPEGAIRANKSCLYVQQDIGSTVLWFNTIGNGSIVTGVVK